MKNKLYLSTFLLVFSLMVSYFFSINTYAEAYETVYLIKGINTAYDEAGRYVPSNYKIWYRYNKNGLIINRANNNHSPFSDPKFADYPLYTYDKNNRMISYDNDSFFYDKNNRLIRSQNNPDWKFDDTQRVFEYVYDKKGRMVQIKLYDIKKGGKPNKNNLKSKDILKYKGDQITYIGFGKRNRPVSLSYDKQGNVKHYDVFGQLYSGEQATTSRDYENTYENGRLVKQVIHGSESYDAQYWSTRTREYIYEPVKIQKSVVEQVKKQQWGIINGNLNISTSSDIILSTIFEY